MRTVEEFILWEQASRDSIDVKRCYIDLAGDLVAGILLSQIIYWFLPSDRGSKLRVEREGRYWLAKQRTDWWAECRISAKQFDRALSVLVTGGLVEHKRFRFGGSPTVHIWLNWDAVVEGVSSILTFGQNRTLPFGELEVDETGNSLTETTAKTTTKETHKKGYGEFLNVRLTDIERQKLIDKFGEAKTLDLIERLSGYKKSKGKAYRDDYATLLNWSRRDGTPTREPAEGVIIVR